MLEVILVSVNIMMVRLFGTRSLHYKGKQHTFIKLMSGRVLWTQYVGNCQLTTLM